MSGRLTDFIARPVRQSVLLTPPASIHFFWLLCRRAFIANGVMLSEIDMELTSQTVVFAFFVCQSGATIAGAFQFSNKQGLRDRSSDEKKSSLGDCGARQVLSHGGNMTQRSDPHGGAANATRSKKIGFSKEAKLTLITGSHPGRSQWSRTEAAPGHPRGAPACHRRFFPCRGQHAGVDHHVSQTRVLTGGRGRREHAVPPDGLVERLGLA